MVELSSAKWRLGGRLVVAVCALVAKTVLLEKYDVVYLFIDPVWALSRPRISDFHASIYLVFCTTFLSSSDERVFERDSTLFFLLPSLAPLDHVVLPYLPNTFTTE